MEKKVLMILAVSFIFLGLYPMMLQKFYPEYGRSRSASLLKQTDTAVPEAAKKTASIAATTVETGDYASEADVLFKNDKLRLLFNEKGGSVREISFLDYMDSDGRDPIKLISAKNPVDAPFSIGILSPSAAATDTQNDISIDRNTVVLKSVILNGDMQVTKKYVFSRLGYSADLSVTFENVSDKSIDFQYELFAGSRIAGRHSIDSQYIEANFFTTREGKASLRHIKQHGLGKKVESDGTIDWVAYKDRHFSVIIKPKAVDLFTGLVRGLGNNQEAVSVVSPLVPIPSGGSVTQDFIVYMGPNDLSSLLPLGLEDIVNFGKLDLFGKLFVGALEMLHKIFRNYGLAIIALTILINILLFPLTRQSFLSMKRMQLIQPQMTKLREKYKDNAQQLNKEMMELYKKNKVNPFGGCLPMILQMPVFIALYVALSKYVKLINANFLWARDLSSPDKVALPFSLPFLGSDIHVLPLIMIGAMAAQQQLTSMNMAGQDASMAQQQKMMAYMMPVIFGFIFYSMPSGLVLYWLTNTVLMTSYQLYLKRVNVSL